jgi:hypothetical protein
LSRIARAIASRLGLRSGPIQEIIESQIVPRLLIADAISGPASGATVTWAPTAEDAAELARLLIEHDARVAREYIGVLRAKGVTEAAVWLQLIAPTARHLGDLAQQPHADAARFERAQRELRALVTELERSRPAHYVLAAEPLGDR